jgi:hypothetical protein
MWQLTAPRFSRYFWWYSSARQKVSAGTTWVTMGFENFFSAVRRAMVAFAVDSCSGEWKKTALRYC